MASTNDVKTNPDTFDKKPYLADNAEVDIKQGQMSGEGGLSEHQKGLEKKLLFKIDTLILPIIVVVYLLNYIDRNNYAAARLQGLEEDLNLHGDQYQTGLSVFFVGYVLMQVPSNALLNYSGRPSLYLGFWIVAWGLVSALTCLVKSFAHIVVCRFILGFVEAPFFAGVLFYVSKWYTRSELGFRMAIFYSGSLLSGAFGNLIAGGILRGLDGKQGLAAWQWLYIIEGVVTIFVGFIVMLLLPDFPHTWKVLTPELRAVAIQRMALDANQDDVDEEGAKSHVQGVRQALTDPKTYILAIMYHCQTGSTGFSNFFPSLTQTLGFDRTTSLLLVAPPYIFAVIWAYGHSLYSDKVQNRFWFWVYPIPLAITGCLLFMFVPLFGVRYFAMFLMSFAFILSPTIFAWMSSSIPRPPAKRAAALAFINSFGNIASVWTPFTYTTNSGPYYRPALGMMIGLLALGVVLGVVLRFYLQRENAKLEQLESEASVSQQPHDTARDVEATQAQRGFRYMI